MLFQNSDQMTVYEGMKYGSDLQFAARISLYF